jgi:hypothetical protein
LAVGCERRSTARPSARWCEVHAADLEFTAGKATDIAFERQHFDDVATRTSPSTSWAIESTKPTVTDDMVEPSHSSLPAPLVLPGW